MQGIELAVISVAPSDFQNFFEVATGPCKNAVNLAGGDFLSSLFSLLSFLCSLPSSLLGADPFLSHPAGPGPLANPVCQSGAVVQNSNVFSSLFSLLASLCALLSSLSSRLSSLIPLCSLPSSLF